MPDAPVTHQTLRALLRAATAAAHARLDAGMAHGLANDRDYRSYLRGMHAFVAGTVPAVRAHAAGWEWRLPDWQDLLARDLQHVDPGARPLAVEAAATPCSDAALGALYVIEGSALGARLLLRDARRLGHTQTRGGAFLHEHGADAGAGRWAAFLRLLEDVGRNVDRRATCAGAEDTFQLAERCFRRARDPAA
jgi:heme oxygenase